MQVSTAQTHGSGTLDSRGPRRLHLPSVSIPERVHYDEHMMLWQARGSAEAVLDGVSRTLTAGHAIWMPAGTKHVLHVHENSVMLPMFFEIAGVATTLQGAATVRVDHELRTLFLAYIQSQQTIIRPDADIARQILSTIERQPALSTSLVMPVSEAAGGIAEILRFNPGDSRTADELAAQVHASLRTIERAFKAETGMTLREWRIQNRMERAVELLRSVHSLEAVAHRVGYTNASAFRRVFKGHFGMTPSEYVARYVTA
ncbi:helix-turn-helix domain-containing protein [Leucobacter sp.]